MDNAKEGWGLCILLLYALANLDLILVLSAVPRMRCHAVSLVRPGTGC